MKKGNIFTSAYTFVHIRVKSNRVVCATLRLKSCIIHVYEGCSFNTRDDCYIVNSVVVHKTTIFPETWSITSALDQDTDTVIFGLI